MGMREALNKVPTRLPSRSVLLILILYSLSTSHLVEHSSLPQPIILRGQVIDTYAPDVQGVAGARILLVQICIEDSMRVRTSGGWITDHHGSFQLKTEVPSSDILLVVALTEDSQLQAVVNTSLAPGMAVDIGTVNPATTIATDLFLQQYWAGVRDRQAYAIILANVRAELALMEPVTEFRYHPRILRPDSVRSVSPFHPIPPVNGPQESRTP